MASGSIKVYGDDVLEALTDYGAKTGYERKLNDEGETLADLIAERVIEKLRAKLSLALPEE